MTGKSLALIAVTASLAASASIAGQISVVNPGTIFFYTPPTPTPTPVSTPVPTPVPTPTVRTAVVARADVLGIPNVITGAQDQTDGPFGNTETAVAPAANVPFAVVQQFNPTATLSPPQMQIAMTQIQAILASPSGLSSAQVTTLRSHLALMQTGLNQ
ncbi:MAG: hypothetical protein P8Q92_11290 [Pseudoprimorskyibacter sp.]|nr:hypothetical protein [Pseudoprimorskyibacter sp.]